MFRLGWRGLYHVTFRYITFGATNKVPYAEPGDRQRESFEIDKVG